VRFFFKDYNLQWRLLTLTSAIVAGGLIYDYSISTRNSRDLGEVMEKAYPDLQKVALMKFKLKSIQTKLYEEVTLNDEKKFLLIQAEGQEFLEILNHLEDLNGDDQKIKALGRIFETYLDRGEEISRHLIRRHGDFGSIQPLIDDFYQSGKNLQELIRTLETSRQDHFRSIIENSRQGSQRMLWASLWSSVIGIVLFAVVLATIIGLNRGLSSANNRLEVRTQELESFIYTISHDLKSPVVSTHGIASVLKRNYADQLDERICHYLERIISNAAHMDKLIQGLSELSKIGGKNLQGKKEAREVLAEVLQKNRSQFEEKKISVIVQSPFPQFSFEQSQFFVLLQNLITNAIKFMGDQPHPQIEVGGSVVGAGVEFFVKDNGIGIDRPYHEKIFELFHRLQDVEAEGIGVGLAAVKKLINLNQGRIRVESGKGRGSTFYFWLPKKAPSEI